MTPPAELLQHIDPSSLAYDEWLSVGMALKSEGADPSTWETWSQRDTKRYKPGECERKWAGFNGSGVTAGTLVEFAKRQGWRPERQRSNGPGREYAWDDTIGGSKEDLVVVDTGWIEDAEIAPVAAPPWKQLRMYIEALFEASDHVGYVCESWQSDERWLPKKGVYHRTAGELIADLSKYQELGAALGDFNPDAGAWIRFNPLDGQGVKDSNVTAFRFALIESDTLSVEKQAAVYADLELPIVALVHSGGKSLHAIVRVGATSMEEYRERVNFLHKVCETNGLAIDKQNKNPSRLSRMPGATRKGVPQALIGLNQGRASWEDWREWIEELNDSLPDIEPLASIWDNLPPLAPPLIGGILRQGHKMLLAGPSKAGKSYLLLQLAIGIAEGRDWLGWPCAQGRVLYVNLELDRPSCLQRIKTLYAARGWEPKYLENIDTWNLRGKAVPMDRLAPKLIRRAAKAGYAAVIIDPIYKVITGDENAADKMAFFCNQFDRICGELGAAVIYCHHHSKGTQGQKSSMDRSSGSGVFARDPDTILDLIELNLERSHRDVLDNRWVCPAVAGFLDREKVEWRHAIGQDTAIVANLFVAAANELLTDAQRAELAALVMLTRLGLSIVSAWRLDATLREFAPVPPREILFTYPVHVADTDEVLASAKAAGEEAPWAAAQREKQTTAKERRQTERESLMTAFSSLSSFDESEPVHLGDLAESMGLTVATLQRRIKKHNDLVIGEDKVVRSRHAAAQHELDAAIVAARDLTGVVKLTEVATHAGVTERGLRKKLERDGRYRIENGLVLPKEDS